MKSIKNLYSIPQEILYFVCFAAWKLCSDNLSKFSALKAIYSIYYCCGTGSSGCQRSSYEPPGYYRQKKGADQFNYFNPPGAQKLAGAKSVHHQRI